MAEVAFAISGKVSDLLVAPIGRQLGYLFQFNGNLKTLQLELEKLRNLKDDLRQEVEVARNNVDKILNTVETWLESVGSVEGEVQSIVEDEARLPKGCINSWCLNLKARYVLSRRAKKRTRDIIELLQEGKFPKVSLPAPPILFTSSTSTTLNSRELILEEIIKNLNDENISMIGICGMGGVGKTTMVEEVFKRVNEKNLFDDYAKTIVSQKVDTAKVQNDIAEMLSLIIKENNPVLRASRLNQRLEGKKVLIILDDVWEEFDLQALGITLQVGQSKCKVVYTSRTQGLWMDFRSRRHELPLDPLPDDESWNLFNEKIGVFLDENPDLVPTAEQIVKECAGLPLALVTLARALNGKREHTWNDTLLKLSTTLGVEPKVYKSLRLSYDHLDDEEAKSVFLLCSLFEEDSCIVVESLVTMGMGLRLFRGINSIEAARDRVFAIVEHLRSRCLVSEGEAFITVHDVVRDVSKSIAFTERGSLVIEYGVTLETLLEQNLATTEHCTWISLMSNEIKELPSMSRFPRLELLRCTNNDLQISDSCFEGLVNLQVVDVMCSKVPELPSSLRSLTSLRSLCLRHSRFADFAAIKFLQNLEILRIANNFIEGVPKEIGHLTKLRLLDMRVCEKLKKVCPGIISGLSNLEELYLGGLIIDRGEKEYDKSGIATHREFESLYNLHILHFAIQDPRMLQGTPLLQNLKKFQIHLGNSKDYQFIRASENYERILSVSHVSLGEDFDFLLHKSEALLLKGESTKSLVFELVRGESQSIRCLEIHDTDTPEYLANIMDCSKPPFLVSTLESLMLSKLNNLQQITNGPLLAENFALLKKLNVRNCNQLRNIFWLSNGVCVLLLEKLRVYDCESLEEVICWVGREGQTNRKLLFPKLKVLKIGGNTLVCFCKGANEIEFHQLMDLTLMWIAAVECVVSVSDVNVNSIFPHKVFFPKLVAMTLFYLKNMKEIWCGQPQSGSFYNLSTLIIKGCDNLEYVFSRYTATYFVHLRTLKMTNCSSLKNIVNGLLVVGSLLKLNELYVTNCNQLRNIFQLSTAVDTVDLELLEINQCGNMEEVISWEGRQEDATGKLQFPNVHLLHISNASSLICFCKGVVEIEFHQLTSLSLRNIPEAEYLISNSNENPLKYIFPHKVSFPGLRVMALWSLKNMKKIWCGQLQAGSFNNLSRLVIKRCDSLEYVFSPCTARYLVHLRRLNISECNNLREVISAKKEVDGIEEYTGSILPKLKDVQLYKLPAPERFYHVADDIEFPELYDVGIIDFPVFKSFSMGFVHTPSLNYVKLYEEDILVIEEEEEEEDKRTMWKGNLNRTIQHLREDEQQRLRQQEQEDDKESSNEKDIKEES